MDVHKYGVLTLDLWDSILDNNTGLNWVKNLLENFSIKVEQYWEVQEEVLMHKKW
jgi:hypothetical protein